MGSSIMDTSQKSANSTHDHAHHQTTPVHEQPPMDHSEHSGHEHHAHMESTQSEADHAAHNPNYRANELLEPDHSHADHTGHMETHSSHGGHDAHAGHGVMHEGHITMMRN